MDTLFSQLVKGQNETNLKCNINDIMLHRKSLTSATQYGGACFG
jgi:hypothetical protein